MGERIDARHVLRRRRTVRVGRMDRSRFSGRAERLKDTEHKSRGIGATGLLERELSRTQKVPPVYAFTARA